MTNYSLLPTEEFYGLYAVDSWDPLEPDLGSEGPVIGIESDFLRFESEFEGVKQDLRTPPTPKDRAIRPVVGMEVGDDVVNLSDRPDLLAYIICSQEVYMQMSTSWEDTCISSNHFNFCEVTSEIPICPEQSLDYIRKTGKPEFFGFTDVLPQRVIMPVAKQIGDYSSTTVGKMAWARSRLSLVKPSLRGMLNLANLFQDAMLRTDKAPEPKYLPQVMGGTGVGPAFDKTKNLYLYALLYKSGTYQRIYASATKELQQTLYDAEEGIASSPKLCKRLRMKKEYLHGTYDSLVFVPKRDLNSKISSSKEVRPLYMETSSRALHLSTEQRLISAKKILAESDAEIEWLKTLNLRKLLFSTDFGREKEAQRIERKLLRQAFDGALSANSALQRLLARHANHHDRDKMLRDPGFEVVTTGAKRLSIRDCAWLHQGGKTEVFSILDISFQENMYLREEVSSEQTMKVAGITLREQKSNRQLVTSTRLGLYQISRPMLEWAENITSKLVLRREEIGKSLPPSESIPILVSDLEWVQDDTGLIARAFLMVSNALPHKTSLILISQDTRLAHRIARSIKQDVYLTHPAIIPKILGEEPFTSETEISVEDVVRVWSRKLPHSYHPPSGVLLDSGSIMASLIHYESATCVREFIKLDSKTRTAYYRRTSPNGRGSLYRRIVS